VQKLTNVEYLCSQKMNAYLH